MSSEFPLPAFYILGPTAVGKSHIAVALAERCDGEIVGADAFQIYTGLEILTAQPEKEIRDRVPHHLVGEVPLSREFDVAQYLSAAKSRIEEIRARGKQAIVVGGTGLYVRALTRGLAELPRGDAALRARLASMPVERLLQDLRQLDPTSADRIDGNNSRRVIRALETCLLTGRPFSDFRAHWEAPLSCVRGVILTRERDELYERIDSRTETMFAAGVVDEVRAAGDIGATATQAIGWRDIHALLAGAITRDECVSRIQRATRRYAKRQMTWFRREAAFKTADLSAACSHESLIERLALEIGSV